MCSSKLGKISGRHLLTWEKLELISKMQGYPTHWKTHSMFNSR